MAKTLRRHYPCPTELAVDVLGGKWKTVILARIKEGPLGYGDLRRRIPSLSDKVLSAKLRELESLGLIEHVSTGGTARSRYRLSRRGEALRTILDLLYRTGQQLGEELAVTFAPPADEPVAPAR